MEGQVQGEASVVEGGGLEGEEGREWLGWGGGEGVALRGRRGGSGLDGEVEGVAWMGRRGGSGFEGEEGREVAWRGRRGGEWLGGRNGMACFGGGGEGSGLEVEWDGLLEEEGEWGGLLGEEGSGLEGGVGRLAWGVGGLLGAEGEESGLKRRGERERARGRKFVCCGLCAIGTILRVCCIRRWNCMRSTTWQVPHDTCLCSHYV